MDVGKNKIAINIGKAKTLFKTGNKTIKARKLTPYFLSHVPQHFVL